ncbi:MAG: hypothetical protein ACN6PR_18445, partial [Achromobacter sp.]
LGHEHAFGGAVGQRDGLLHQPDQVGRQVALLLLGQCNAKLDAVVAGELRAGGEQSLVLAVVVAVVVEEALAGGGQNISTADYLKRKARNPVKVSCWTA